MSTDPKHTVDARITTAALSLYAELPPGEKHTAEDYVRAGREFLRAYLTASQSQDPVEDRIAEIRERQRLRDHFDREFSTAEERSAHSFAQTHASSDCARAIAELTASQSRERTLSAKLSAMQAERDKLAQSYRCYSCKQRFDEDDGHGLASEHFGSWLNGDRPKCEDCLRGTATWGGGPHDPFYRVRKESYDALESERDQLKTLLKEARKVAWPWIDKHRDKPRLTFEEWRDLVDRIDSALTATNDGGGNAER